MVLYYSTMSQCECKSLNLKLLSPIYLTGRHVCCERDLALWYDSNKLSHCYPFQLNISFLWVCVWSKTRIFLTVFILCVLALSFWLPLHHDPYWEGSAVSCRLGCQLSCWSGICCARWHWMTWKYHYSSSSSCSDIYGLCLKGKAPTLFEFWQSRRSRSRNWLDLGSEVERFIMQGEPDPLLRETVDGRCWPNSWWLDTTIFLLE